MFKKFYQNKGIHGIICNLPDIIKKSLSYSLYLYRKNTLLNLKTPKSLIFFITNRCNAKCKHCFYWKKLNTQKKEELNLDQIRKFVKSLRHPLSAVLLTGGEPFLREDLVEICKIFYRYNKTSGVVLPTNGYLPKVIFDSVRNILNETNLYVDVSLSLDGFEKTSYKTRGLKDIFEKNKQTIELLKTIKNKRFRLFLLTVVSNKNYKEIIKLINFNKKNWKIPHRIQYVRSCNEVYNIDPKLLSGFAQKDEKFSIPSLSKMRTLNEKLKKTMNINNFSMKINNLEKELVFDILKNKKRNIDCTAGIYDGVVFPNGDVSICELTKPFGNLKDTNYDFYELWNNDKSNEMRSKLKKCACIHSCNLSSSLKHDRNMLFKILSK